MTESEFRGAVASWFIRGERSVMDCERWMRGTGYSSAMAAMGCDRETARRALALLYIHRERNDILDDDQPLDKVLGRLVAGLAQRLEEGETMERIVGAVARAKPVFQAWKARDKSTVIHFLADEAVRKRLQGADDASETMAMLKAIAGDEVRQRRGPVQAGSGCLGERDTGHDHGRFAANRRADGGARVLGRCPREGGRW